MERKIYFPGLDGLRFIAIAFVVLHHFFTFRNNFSTVSIDIPVIGSAGYFGIQFFFAGSGFLITYLLLAEKSKNGRIALGKFYLRRILRIWPAYYVLILLALVLLFKTPFFQIPGVHDTYLGSDYQKANLLYFLFLPHFAGIYFPTAPYIHQTYTIGMEEQFYFLWGIIFTFLSKHLRFLFFLMAIGIPALCFTGDLVAGFSIYQDSVILQKADQFISLLRYFRIPTFAVGALWAIACFNRSAWLNAFRSAGLQISWYLLVLSVIVLRNDLGWLSDEIIAILTLGVFTSATFTDTSIVNYEKPVLKFLGKISYGIYLFHMFAIVIVVKVSREFWTDISSWHMIVLLAVLTLLVSVFFGWLSYITVEKFFLSIKKRLRSV